MYGCLSKLWYQFICKWCVWWWWWWWWCFYNEGSIRPDKVCCAVEKLATSKACAPEGISQVCQQNNLSFTSFGGFLVHILHISWVLKINTTAICAYTIWRGLFKKYNRQKLNYIYVLLLCYLQLHLLGSCHCHLHYLCSLHLHLFYLSLSHSHSYSVLLLLTFISLILQINTSTSPGSHPPALYSHYISQCHQ